MCKVETVVVLGGF